MSTGPQRPQGLALVGMRGTGKSTVGRILAERTGRPFVDADVALERMSGRSIASIFAEEGESIFRDWEAQVLVEVVLSRPGAILATGGGAILRESNRVALRSFGFVVWLRVDPSEASSRLLSDQGGLSLRPALTSAGTLAEIAAVLEARTPLYQGLADVALDTSARSPEEVAQAILEVWPAPVGLDRRTVGFPD